MDFSKIINFVSTGISGVVLQGISPQKSNFENSGVSDSNLLLIIIGIILLIYTLFAIATYKLTGSALQTLCFVIFGGSYISLAYLYYAFAGYKFTLRN